MPTKYYSKPNLTFWMITSQLISELPLLAEIFKICRIFHRCINIQAQVIENETNVDLQQRIVRIQTLE